MTCYRNVTLRARGWSAPPWNRSVGLAWSGRRDSNPRPGTNFHGRRPWEATRRGAGEGTRTLDRVPTSTAEGRGKRRDVERAKGLEPSTGVPTSTAEGRGKRRAVERAKGLE